MLVREGFRLADLAGRPFEEVLWYAAKAAEDNETSKEDFEKLWQTGR